MAVWVDCHAAAAYFSGSFAADMGPYIGPWPLLPPGEMGGLSSSAQVDFFVALPNPGALGDVTVVADGTYDTPIWDAYRYFTTAPDTLFDYYGDVTGTTPSVPPTAPVGSHLYVLVYDGSSAPTNPPEFYVPATYAAGGAAAFETQMGHWSGDQAPFSQTKHVSPAAGTDSYYYQADRTYVGDHDITAAVADEITETLAATPLNGGGTPALSARKRDVTGFFDTNVTLISDAGFTPYNGAAALADDEPPALGALTYGVDYVNTPTIGPDGSSGTPYQYDTAAGWAWAAGASDGTSGEEYTDTSSGLTLPIGITTRMQWVAGTIAGRPWTISGNLIGDVLSPPGSPAAWATDYSSVTALAFTVHQAPTFLYDGSITGPTDFSMPALANHGFDDGPTVTPSTPDLLIDRSTWQYWVPGDIVPMLAWRPFVAGAFETASGATLYINTPGLGLVPVLDGPG